MGGPMPNGSYRHHSTFRPSLLLAFFLLIGPSVAFAQVGFLAGPIVAGATGKSLLDQAKGLITQTMNDAQNTGNALLARAGNEMSLMVATIDVVAGRQLDKGFKELDDKTKQAFYKLDELTVIAQSAG